jgi:NodT family efflux transporter outer membrane factor (OMF) lipoprotein
MLALLTVTLSACTVGPDYHPPSANVPTQWTTPPTVSNEQSLAQWWQGFHDARLTALVERALRDNLDLKTAAARLSAARAQSQAAYANLWPSLGAGTAYQRQRISPNALLGILGSAQSGGQSSTGLLSSIGPLGQSFNLFQASLESSWELDLFGGNRRRLEAAQANTAAVAEIQRGIRVSLSAEVVRDYVSLIALQRHADIAAQRLVMHQTLHKLAQQAYQEGLVSVLDVNRSQTEQEAVAAILPNIQQQIQHTQHGLALLLSLPPVGLQAELAKLDQTLPPPPALPTGVPADLLRRRPDIRQAERELAAATASVGAAIAELFPKITLTGAVGLQSQDISNFGQLASGFYGFGPRLSLPLFQAGRLQAMVEAQKQLAEAAAKHYDQTVLTALREVEDALASLHSEQQRKQTLAAAATSGQRNVATARALYQEGAADLQTVLDAQRSWYDVQDQLTDSELAWTLAHIALFKALGGGWNAL